MTVWLFFIPLFLLLHYHGASDFNIVKQFLTKWLSLLFLYMISSNIFCDELYILIV